MRAGRWHGFGFLGSLAIAAVCISCSSPDAAALYTQNCARCHGATGQGDPRQVGLYPDLNLTQAAPIKLQARGVLYIRISQGYGAMPGFAHRLDEDELEALVAYINRFAAVPQGH